MHYFNNDKIRVLLVFPRFRLPSGDPPLGLAYIASSLLATQKASVRIFDATFNPKMSAFVSAIDEFDPDVVGIFVDTLMYNEAVIVAELARTRGKFVITGGPHASVMPESLIICSDIVVTGEGEQTMALIVERYGDRDFASIPGIWYKIGDEIQKTASRCVFADLDSIAFPAFELLDMVSYISHWSYLDCLDTSIMGTNILSSRGCPYQCTYCQPTLSTIFGKKLRHRSAENIIDEIRFLQDRYNINSFFFHDDTLTADKNRIVSLCESFNRSGLKLNWACNTRVDTLDFETMKIMREAGLRKLHIGAESGSQRILDMIYRKTTTIEQVRNVVDSANTLGIHSFCFFILGAPTETKHEISQTIRFATSLRIDEVSFSILSPLPGTAICDRIAADSRYEVSRNLSDYNYHSKRLFHDPELSSSYIKFAQVLALFMFYAHYHRWHYVIKHLTTMRGISKLYRKIRRFFS